MSSEIRIITAAHFEAIVDIAADAIISVDDNHNIVLFNKGAEEIFGYTSGEVLAKPLNLLIPERFRPKHGDHVRTFAASNSAARRMGERREIFGLRKSGAEFPAEASISKISADGKWMFTVVLRDVTDRYKTEAEKTRLLEAETSARASAEQATRMRDEILGIVSHDLRNPLSVISMCARALETEFGESDPRALEVATTIKSASSWMQRMIRDLLDVASIEAGKLSIESRPSDLVIKIVQAVEACEAMAAERSVTVVTDIPEQLPLVEADGDRILQVITNLLNNAIKFSNPGDTVTVNAGPEDQHLFVSVADSGVGISPNDLPHVFHRFWQSRKNSTTRGSGLGLAIAKGIVDAHNGSLTVESEPGKGSTFRMRIPVRQT